jgi:adenosylmethionine-8-amino-7-oxononanoate aminotransferase
MKTDDILRTDRELVWHPYAALPGDDPRYVVESAQGTRLQLAGGHQLLDGMSSWWSTILGYRHPDIMRAAHQQLDTLPHVMFGGLTHAPAAALAQKLVDITPSGLNRVFFCDSGSVSVEVAMKMAVQYWAALGQPSRKRFATIRHGYHGDTWGAMSLCDPELGMHSLFAGAVLQQVFAPGPHRAGAGLETEDLAALEQALTPHLTEVCAVVLEPIVQATGGMRFYSPEYLAGVRELCDRHGLLLIADEIATGFGRTGRLFACEHAGISPDILCVGKALTGGTLTLAATLTTSAVSEAISSGTPGLFMHGPTFMGNPLACAVAVAVLEVLDRMDWQGQVQAIEAQLEQELSPCRSQPGVADVRVMGAIGVVEMKQPLSLGQVIPRLVDRGVWLRPFGRLLYTMPPFITTSAELSEITAAMCAIAESPKATAP